MFDDPAQEINDLTAVIKQDITALNAAISDLQQTASSRHENNESGSHNLTVVDALKGRLVRAAGAARGPTGGLLLAAPHCPCGERDVLIPR